MRFPHHFSGSPGHSRADIEIAAILAATIAWGRRDLILKSAEKLFALMDWRPHDFVMAGNFRRLRNRAGVGAGATDGTSIHRTFFEEDLKYFCRGFRYCYGKYGDLETLFLSGIEGVAPPDTGGRIWNALHLFRMEMAAGNNGAHSKHIADPFSASACKRLHLSLRWLVRREGPVDLGLWTRISPAELCIPLDLHVGRVARRLGLLDPARKANDRKAVLSLTARLREFCPEDPARYDLALFGMGVGEPG